MPLPHAGLRPAGPLKGRPVVRRAAPATRLLGRTRIGNTDDEQAGATHEDLKLMRKHTPEHVQVKAAGGVRDFDALLAVRELGVTRVGASATIAILDECRKRLGTGGGTA